MSTATRLRPERPLSDSLGLQQPHLPRWAPWVVALVAVAVVGAVLALTGSYSHGLMLVLSVLLFGVLLVGTAGRVEGARGAKDRLATTVVSVCLGLALLPLVSVLYVAISRGVTRLDATFFLTSLRGLRPTEEGGGAYHAIIGTLEITAIATVISVPVGLLTAVYLVEYGRGALAKAITFLVDVMTGIPSIVAGLFVYSLWILTLGFSYSGFAGALSLAVLMIPVVVRSSEEMLKLVSVELHEAAYALGVPKWRTIVSVVIPTALAGIATGVTLAIARVIGETAPLLLTTFTTDAINFDPFNGPMMSLPQYIYNQIRTGLPLAAERAWAAALTLILIVMLLNLVARLIARVFSPQAGR